MSMEINKKEEEKAKSHVVLFVALIITLLLISIAAGLLLGSTNITLSTVWDTIKLKVFGIENGNLKKSYVTIIWELRFPRVLLAIAAGGGLAVAGAAMQALTQNILADPYILGASSGASAMVAFAYFLGGNILYSKFGIPVMAFLGAVVSLAFVYAIGMVGRAGSSSRLVLAGMSVSVILNAVTQFFISINANANNTRSLMSWMMGSLAGTRWDNLAVPFWGSIIGSLFFMFTARAFNLLSLGDDTATNLGINVNEFKKITIIVVSFITGIIVSAGGLIGFVGFIIPHIVRFIAGADYRKLFPLSYLTGGLFLLWMDILARTVLAPQEMAIGIFTAFCGGPFFVWLLYRKN